MIYLLAMRYFSLFVLFVLCVPALRLLGEDVAEPKPTAFNMAASIQPRNEGAHWIYTSKMFEGGKWSSAGSSREDVQEVIEIDGVKCYKVQLTIDWRGVMDRLSGQQLTEDDFSYYWEYMNEQGSYNFSGEDADAIKFPPPTSLEQFELTMPYPVKKGHSYIADDCKYEVIETDAKVEVPAGTFVCTVYQILYDEDPERITRERFYMSKGVGLIRWEEYEKIDEQWGQTFQENLIRYDLKLPVLKTDDNSATDEETIKAVPVPLVVDAVAE